LLTQTLVCIKQEGRELPAADLTQIFLNKHCLCFFAPKSFLLTSCCCLLPASAAAAGWCMCCCLPQVRQIAVSFSSNLADALPGHVQRMVRCMTQLSSACSNHAGLAWVEWQPPVLQAMLQHLMATRWAGGGLGVGWG
jgi:hypothetical protein